MKINWKVRVKNKVFWVSLIPMMLLLVQQICGLFGVSVDVTAVSEQLVGIVGTVFVILGLLGVVVDHTTEGVSDSENALTYEKPKGAE